MREPIDDLPEPVRVRLTVSPPVGAEHGLAEGMVLDGWTDEESPRHPSLNDPNEPGRAWFIGAVWVTAPGSGRRVRLLSREFEVVK